NAQEVAPGAAIITTASAQKALRASQIGTLTLQFFSVLHNALGDILTLPEVLALESLAVDPARSHQVFPPEHPLSVEFERVARECREHPGLNHRLKCLTLFSEMVSPNAKPQFEPRDKRMFSDDRLAELVQSLSESELLERAPE